MKIKYILFFIVFFSYCQFEPVKKNPAMDYILLTDLIKNRPVQTQNNQTPIPIAEDTNTENQEPFTPEEIEGASIPGTVKIYANINWQKTTFILTKNTEYLIQAYGTWTMTGDKKTIPPEGLETNPSFWGDFRYDQKFNHGQLLCRSEGVPEILFSVGNIKLTETGEMQCRINDTDLENNTGYLEIKATEIELAN